jgi:hypothetical protein
VAEEVKLDDLPPGADPTSVSLLAFPRTHIAKENLGEIVTHHGWKGSKRSYQEARTSLNASVLFDDAEEECFFVMKSVPGVYAVIDWDKSDIDIKAILSNFCDPTISCDMVRDHPPLVDSSAWSTTLLHLASCPSVSGSVSRTRDELS